jgi:hypothetical protein
VVAAVVVLLVVLLLAALLPLRRPRPRRRRRRRKSLTRTWVSVSSTRCKVNIPPSTENDNAYLTAFTIIMRFGNEHLGGVERAIAGIMEIIYGHVLICTAKIP